MPGPIRTANVTGTCGAAIRTGLSLVLFLLLAPTLPAQANGTLQLHFMNVGQGDGAVLISPGGQIVLFDSGVLSRHNLPAAILDRWGPKGLEAP